MYALVLLYNTKQPFQAQLSRRLAKNKFSHHLYFGLLSHRILKPTEVFLLYICVLTTLSNYTAGLGCEADCQYMATHSQ